MSVRSLKIIAVVLGCLTLSGCAVGVGAAAAVIADEVAENRGGNLF